MTINYNRRDDDGHRYAIPEDQLLDFDTLQTAIEDSDWLSDQWYDLITEFNDKFHQYMVG